MLLLPAQPLSLVFTLHLPHLCTLRVHGVSISTAAMRTELMCLLDLVWTADHDLEDGAEGQIDVYSGRGIVSESVNGPVWLIGTGSEHHAIVQYNFANSKNVYAGLIQTETVSIYHYGVHMTGDLRTTFHSLTTNLHQELPHHSLSLLLTTTPPSPTDPQLGLLTSRTAAKCIFMALVIIRSSA